MEEVRNLLWTRNDDVVLSKDSRRDLDTSISSERNESLIVTREEAVGSSRWWILEFISIQVLWTKGIWTKSLHSIKSFGISWAGSVTQIDNLAFLEWGRRVEGKNGESLDGKCGVGFRAFNNELRGHRVDLIEIERGIEYSWEGTIKSQEKKKSMEWTKEMGVK